MFDKDRSALALAAVDLALARVRDAVASADGSVRGVVRRTLGDPLAALLLHQIKD